MQLICSTNHSEAAPCMIQAIQHEQHSTCLYQGHAIKLLAANYSEAAPDVVLSMSSAQPVYQMQGNTNHSKQHLT